MQSLSVSIPLVFMSVAANAAALFLSPSREGIRGEGNKAAALEAIMSDVQNGSTSGKALMSVWSP